MKKKPKVKKAAPETPDLCDTMTTLAYRMVLHYKNPDGSSKLRYDLSRATICDFKKGRRLNGKPAPPGTIGARQQYSLRAWVAWFDANLWNEWKFDSTRDAGRQSLASLEELREQDERDELEFNKWERDKEKGKYVEAIEAGRIAGGVLRQLGDYWRHRNEGTLIEASKAKLLALGISTDLSNSHTEWLAAEHQKFTDAIEAKCAEYVDKYNSALKVLMEKWMPK